MNTNLPEIVGKNMRAAYDKLNVSQSEFAKALGISPSMLSSVFKGKRRLQLHRIVRASELLNLSPDYFFGLKGDEFFQKDEIIDVDELSDSEVDFLNKIADILIERKSKKQKEADLLLNMAQNDNN